jgi:hypothetical protein
LRPELVRLLERHGCSESDRTSPAAQAQRGDRFAALSSDLIPYTSGGSSPSPPLVENEVGVVGVDFPTRPKAATAEGS